MSWDDMDAAEKDLRASGHWGTVQMLNDPDPDIRALWTNGLTREQIATARAAALALRGAFQSPAPASRSLR